MRNPFSISTREEWESLTDEEAFKVAFPELSEGNWKELLSKNDLEIRQAVYCLRVKNMTGYMEPCHWCQDRRCDGCPLPFVENITYNDLLIKLGSSSNDSFYSSDAYKRGK